MNKANCACAVAYLILALVEVSRPALAQERARFTTEGQWKAENILGSESPIQELGRIALVGDDIFFWARGLGAKNDWRFFHVPDQLLVHHQGRLAVAGTVEPRQRLLATVKRAIYRMVVVGGGRPDVVLSLLPDASNKQSRVLHYDGRQIREVDLGSLSQAVREMLSDKIFKDYAFGYALKPLPWTGQVAIGRWTIDLDPTHTQIQPAPQFATGTVVLDVSDVIDWPHPDEVLAATEKGLYRLTRVP